MQMGIFSALFALAIIKLFKISWVYIDVNIILVAVFLHGFLGL
jgi:hypothetical protein